MPLVLAEKLGSPIKLGDSYIVIEKTGTQTVRLIVDSPRENLVLRSKCIHTALEENGWELEHGTFYANHQEHGRRHIRALEHLFEDARGTRNENVRAI